MMKELLDYLAKYNPERHLRSYMYDFLHTHEGYELHTGATRICVYHKDWDFVLKFDEEYQTTAYCSLECYHYEMAKAYRVERVLLPIERVATFDNGLKIYRQAKFTTGWHDLSNKDNKALRSAYEQTKHSKTFKKIYKGMHHETHGIWVARVTQLYGKKFMRSLENWISEYEVNDLHTGNIGLLNGVPVLLDYAGYRGSSYTPSKEIVDNY